MVYGPPHLFALQRTPHQTYFRPFPQRHLRMPADMPLAERPHRRLGSRHSFPVRTSRSVTTMGNDVGRGRSSRAGRTHRCVHPGRRQPLRRNFFWAILCRDLRGIWEAGGILVSRHAALYILLARQRLSLDHYPTRYAQRPRICLCLGAQSCSFHLVRKPIARSHPSPPLLISFAIYSNPYCLGHLTFQTAGEQFQL